MKNRPNTILKKALKICQAKPGMEAKAREAWEKAVAKYPRATSGKLYYARLAMLTAISKGSKIFDARRAAEKVLAE